MHKVKGNFKVEYANLKNRAIFSSRNHTLKTL